MNTAVKFFNYFGMMMAVVYIILGLLLLIYGNKFFEMQEWVRITFSFALIVYGIFRLIRYYNSSRGSE